MFPFIHVVPSIQDFHDPIEVAKHFLNSSAFQLEPTSGKMLCIELQPKVLGGKFYEFESGKDEYDYVSPVDKRYTDPSNGRKLNVEIYPDTGMCVFKPWVARLVPAFICPLVNISLSDYNVTSQINIICLETPKICSKPEEFIFSGNNLKVLICADSYFASPVPEYTIANEEDLGKVLVSLLCSCLSIICLIITMVKYMLFPVLRTLPGLYTMALCAPMIVAHALFTFGAGAVQIGFVCEVLGIIIHWTMLASVFLMNVFSIHMFHVFSHLDSPVVLTEEEKRRHFLISLVYSYGSSTIFVIGRIVYSMVTTGTSGYGIRVCFINIPIALLFTFTLPVMLLVIANIVMFCIVIVKVSQLPDMSRSSTCRHHQKRFFYLHKAFKSDRIGLALWIYC
ncbi:Latrophilin-3 [Mizuhopecten yessoensis]|uniref:Latrophilin-3 n=1 Tax=Mizuhopecten yessoensis TaxID=6573 RepID=A0A210PK77_MIZYE|nr:Latrophilin-3 [Mizuhopecten yessoensis]